MLIRLYFALVLTALTYAVFILIGYAYISIEKNNKLSGIYKMVLIVLAYSFLIRVIFSKESICL